MTATSEKFFISHQGISKAIHSLENELGVTLIARNGRNIALTEEGMNVISLSEPIIKQYYVLKEQYPGNTPSKALSGNLSILCNGRVLDAYLGDMVARFLRKNPKAHITVQTHTFGEIMNRFGKTTPNGETLGFFCMLTNDNNEMFHKYLNQHDYEFTVYSRDEMFACRPKKMQLENIENSCIPAPDLDKVPIFCYKYDYQSFFEQNENAALRYEVNSIEVLKRFMTAGLGITFLTGYEFEKHFSHYKKYMLFHRNPALFFDFGYLTYQTEQTPLMAAFLQFFRKEYAKVVAPKEQIIKK